MSAVLQLDMLINCINSSTDEVYFVPVSTPFIKIGIMCVFTDDQVYLIDQNIIKDQKIMLSKVLWIINDQRNFTRLSVINDQRSTRSQITLVKLKRELKKEYQWLESIQLPTFDVLPQLMTFDAVPPRQSGNKEQREQPQHRQHVQSHSLTPQDDNESEVDSEDERPRIGVDSEDEKPNCKIYSHTKHTKQRDTRAKRKRTPLAVLK
eukprot:114673_1